MADIARDRATARPAVCTAAMVVGAIFLLIGIAGFIPGLTTNFSGMTAAGHDSDAMLLGVFQVSILHNIVHLLFGVVGLLAGRDAGFARGYLIGGGVIYLVLWLYGLVTSDTSGANFAPFNTADDWLHFVLGAGMIALGVALSRRRLTARP